MPVFLYCSVYITDKALLASAASAARPIRSDSAHLSDARSQISGARRAGKRLKRDERDWGGGERSHRGAGASASQRVSSRSLASWCLLRWPSTKRPTKAAWPLSDLGSTPTPPLIDFWRCSSVGPLSSVRPR